MIAICLTKQTTEEVKLFEAFLREDLKAHPNKYTYTLQRYPNGGALFTLYFNSVYELYYFARREEESQHGI